MILAYTAIMSLLVVLGSTYNVAKLILGPLEWYTTTSLHASQHTTIEAVRIIYEMVTATTTLIASTRASQAVKHCITTSTEHIITKAQEFLKQPVAASSGWLFGGRSRRRRRVGNAFFGFMRACSRGNTVGAQFTPLEPDDV